MKNNKPLKMREELPPETQQAINHLLNNFIIAMVKRNGGRLAFPVAEVDAASGPLTMGVEGDQSILEMETRQ